MPGAFTRWHDRCRIERQRSQPQFTRDMVGPKAFTRKRAKVQRVNLIPIAGIAAALALAASASAAALPAVVAEIGPAYYGSIQVRPAEIVWAGDGAGLLGGRRHPNARPADSEIHWIAWTRSSATGAAYSWLDNCAPDCADGSFTSYPV